MNNETFWVFGFFCLFFNKLSKFSWKRTPASFNSSNFLVLLYAAEAFFGEVALTV